MKTLAKMFSALAVGIFFIAATNVEDDIATTEKPAILTLSYEYSDVSFFTSRDNFLVIELAIAEYTRSLPCRVSVHVQAESMHARKILTQDVIGLYPDAPFVAQKDHEIFRFLVQVDKSELRELLDREIRLKIQLHHVQDGFCDAKMKFLPPKIWGKNRDT